MATKVSRIARAVREDSVGVLAREAVLRVSKRFNLSRFQAEIERVPDLEYRFIGYYKPELRTLSPCDREAIVAFADKILAGEFPLMGYGNVPLGSKPDWSRDWVSGKGWLETSAEELTVVRHDGSDVKAPWELSRLQFLPVLAKANLITGDETFRTAARELASDWIDRNQVGIGVNWTLAMEAALRGISLCLMLELMWPLQSYEQAWLSKVTRSLWQHLVFIEAHNEFSHLLRSNHYLSNIIGLTTLSAALRGPGIDKRLNRYARAVQQEILFQTYADGGDWEASTGYHVLVSQMFLHSYLTQKACGIPVDSAFENRLIAMFDWLSAVADRQGHIPHIGDCDDGRVELLHDDIRQASWPVEQRHSLAVANYLGLGSHIFGRSYGGDAAEAAWFGAKAPVVTARSLQRVELLANSGLAVTHNGDADLIFAAMPNGINGRGSHTHSDKLSFVLRLGDGDVFCDGGTRGYTRDAVIRNRYRSAYAHNVVIVDAEEHNTTSQAKDRLFQCGNEAAVSPIAVNAENGTIILSGSHSGYERFGVSHSRIMRFRKNQLTINDELRGWGSHSIELMFRLAPEYSVAVDQAIGTTVKCRIHGPRALILSCASNSEMQMQVGNSEVSRAYGSSSPAMCIRIQSTRELPASLATDIQWN